METATATVIGWRLSFATSVSKLYKRKQRWLSEQISLCCHLSNWKRKRLKTPKCIIALITSGYTAGGDGCHLALKMSSILQFYQIASRCPVFYSKWIKTGQEPEYSCDDECERTLMSHRPVFFFLWNLSSTLSSSERTTEWILAMQVSDFHLNTSSLGFYMLKRRIKAGAQE